MHWWSPGDPSACVLRRRIPIVHTLYGTDKLLATMDAHLLRRATSSEVYMPLPRTLLLYGRQGSGKTSLLHAITKDEDTGAMSFRYLEKTTFDCISDYRLDHFNMDKFSAWADSCIARLRDMELVKEDAPRSFLMLIGNLHKFNYARSAEPLNALLHLLTVVRLFPSTRSVRVVMLCDESPGQFPSDVHALIDTRVFMAPPDAEARLLMFEHWITRFKQFVDAEKSWQTNDLSRLGWDVSLEKEDLEQDTHILHTLVVASQGSTPKEIVQFLQRSFSGCRTPNPNGETVYGSAWLESLLHVIDGSIKCITASNPVALNESLMRYAGLHVEDTLIGAKTCFVRKTTVDMPTTPESDDDDDDDDDADGDVPQNAATNGKKRKKRARAKASFQPPSVQESIRLRAEAQRKKLEQADRRYKERARDAERSGLAQQNGGDDLYYGIGSGRNDK